MKFYWENFEGPYDGKWHTELQLKAEFVPPGDFEAYVIAQGRQNGGQPQILWTFRAEGYAVRNKQYVMGKRDTASVWMINILLALPALLLA